MDPFYRYHPGSDIAEKLLSEKDHFTRQIVQDPCAAIELLSEKYKFGYKTDFWDDFVFNSIISPALTEICGMPDLSLAINKYSALDEALFLKYIRRDEDPERFRRAFWNVNTFGKQLSSRFKDQFLKNKNIIELSSKSTSVRQLLDGSRHKIAFVFKGQFALAHAEFLHEFLRGSHIFASKVKITLILLDDNASCLRGTGVDHIEIISFQKKSTFEKLEDYYEFALSQGFDHISWVACVQNMTLFMGQRLASSQSYWSMKYHSIIMNSLDKYAGLGFGGESFEFDDIKWFRGRAFPNLSLPAASKENSSNFKALRIPKNSIVAGCFVRSEKLNNIDFWLFLEKLLADCSDLYFLLASQSLPAVAIQYLETPLFKEKFYHLGWVNTKKWCQYLDVYLDSFPRGSCLTALEAVKANVPVVMFDSRHNRESSALPYLMSAGGGMLPPGVFNSENLSLVYDEIKCVISSKDERLRLASQQHVLLRSLEGMSSLFSKDYLNYFLNTDLSVRDAALR